jgi:aldehyde dehydrogenase (NAD+)
MALHAQLTAPNGHTYTQPTGLFINNEWLPSSDGEQIVSINPTCVPPLPRLIYIILYAS